MMDNHVNIDAMIQELMVVNEVNWAIPSDEPSKQALLKTLMTISRPAKLSSRYYQIEKDYLSQKNGSRKVIHVDEIRERLLDDLYIYQGDITNIQADAIVNAANEKLLGCFVPGHKCIDNAIQMASGLGVRNECYDIVHEQGHDEPVGLAKVTKGYNLPSKYIIHTVGPNVNGPEKPTWDQVVQQLAHCYTSILEAANAKEDIKSLVFCSISTGIYGVPIELASDVALSTIQRYLTEEEHHFNAVIINVFSEEDYVTYKNKAKKYTRD